MDRERIKLPNGEVVPIQDAGDTHHKPGQVAVYHTHGDRQYYGTCKYHKRPDCYILVQWKPGRILNGRGQLGKCIMREYVFEKDLPKSSRCKRCWKESET